MTTPYSRKSYELATDTSQTDNDYQKALHFLIQCWQSHGYRTNEQKSGWKTDIHGRESMYSLWNWYRLPQWVIDIAERLRKVQIENRPALDLIERFNHNNVFMFLDPPYLPETRHAQQYRFEMSASEHENILSTIVKSDAKIMITGYDSKLYNDYLKDWKRYEFKTNASNGLPRTEIVWCNYDEYRQTNIFDLLQ